MAPSNKVNKNKNTKQQGNKKNPQEKSAQQKKNKATVGEKKCNCCKWFIGSVVVIALIAAALIYDTQENGKGVFAKSATGKALQNAGLLPYVEKGWYTTMSTSARGYKWAEKHVPPYAKPFGDLTRDLFKVLRNAACNVFSAVKDFWVAKSPVVENFIDQYVPGLSEKIGQFFKTIVAVLIDVWVRLTAFFKTQVFVGNLSPENLAKALNETRNLALDYYQQFHKKVDAYAKLK